LEELVRSLMAKIKTLNETLWEQRAREPNVNEWLDNFAISDTNPPDERVHALFLLSNFMYFGSIQIRELLKALYRDLYRYPIMEGIRRANHDTLDSAVIGPSFEAERRATRFLGAGNPSESGCHLLYYFRQENALSKDLFIHTHEIFTRVGGLGALQLRYPNVTRYIFIDDFCGSGEQGVSYLRDLVEDIRRLKPKVFIGYYVLFATTSGISRIRNETAVNAATAIYELDSTFKCFSVESRYFQAPVPTGIDRVFCRQMCDRYGRTMVDAPHVLGFEDSELLVGFHHNTPDNTLPIIWFDGAAGPPWKPIFRRYPKIEW